jgi:hypothetical protein
MRIAMTSVPKHFPSDFAAGNTRADAIARAMTGHRASEEQLTAATEVAQAQMELVRTRAVRAEFLTQIDLGSADLQTLRRLAALDRYERFAHAKRRRASRKL